MRAFLLGGVLTKVDEHWDKTLPNLMAEAGLKSLEAAGLSTVDAVYTANVYGEVLQEQANLASILAEELGLKGVMASRVEAGGVSGLSAIQSAVAAVNAGLAKEALVVGAEKLSDVTTEEMTSLATMEERVEYVGMLGVSQLAEAALLYKEYMKRHMVKQEDVAYFTVLSHEHASTAAHAQYPFKVSLESVLKITIRCGAVAQA
jgi:acetyl-CoA C-acetyltransferase